MKLKKTAAFIIALSMLVGLLSVFPASALTPVTGYAEEILVDESFDTDSYDKSLLKIENGSIADGSLNFDLVGKSGLALNASMDLAKTKQYIIDFELATDVTYTDPWTATFIGTRNVRAAEAPWDNINGTWLGITKDKLILWHSYEDCKWANETAAPGTHYTLVDNTFDVSDAKYRVIYEGSVAEIYIDQAKDGNYTLMATVTVKSNKGSITVGETNLLSARTFSENQSSRYFSLWNYKAEEEADDPLKPTPKDEKTGGEGEDGGEISLEETKTVKMGSFTVKYYANLLMTDEQRATLEADKARLEEIVAKYGTDERLYYDSSVDTAALTALIAQIDELLSREQAFDSEYTELSSAVATATSVLIDQAAVDAYIARFAGFENTLDSIESDPQYKAEDIEKIRAAIAEAKLIVNAEKLTPNMLDSQFNKVAAMFSALGIYSKDGIPNYSVTFTNPSYTATNFETDWYHTGVNQASVQVSGEDGAHVKMDWRNDRRYMMQLKKRYSNYSFKATITKVSNGMTAMGIRQTYGGNTFEEDKQGISFCGGDSVVMIGTPNSGALNTVYVLIRTMQRGSNNSIQYISRELFAYDLNQFPGALSNENKTATFIIKDMDDVIEFYVVADEGEVRLATIYFNLEKEGTTYTKGTLINNITGEKAEFSGVSIPSPGESVMGFSARNGEFAVKDVVVSTNIAPADEKAANDGKSDPNKVTFATEDGSFNFTEGETKNFTMNAEFDKLKIYGKLGYVAGTVDVKDSSATTITTGLGDKIVAVDAAAGTIKGVKRGTDLITATYKGTTKDFVESHVVTVDGAYTAPAEDSVFDKRIVSAKIANASAFKSIDEGLSVIPVIDYTLPNGDEGVLSDEYYVVYKSTDDSVIAFDKTTGKFVAKKAGDARIWAEVSYKAGTTNDVAKTPEVSVEVTEPGSMTPGVSVVGAINDLYHNAKDSSVTPGEYKGYIEAAIEVGIAISYGKTDDEKLINAMLIKNEIAELTGEVTEDDIKAAVATALEVRKVYDVLASEESNADDLRKILFAGSSDDNSVNSLGISLTKYKKLDSAKASRAVTRVYTQLAKEDVEKLSASKIENIMDTVIGSVAEGGGSGGGGVKNDTNKNKGGGGIGGGTIISKSDTSTTKMPLLTGDAAKAQAEKFADINDAAWAKEAIGALAYEGVVAGYEDGTIRPNAEITRDEFVKLLVCALSVELKADAVTSYSDITSGSWQEPYVAAATEAGIVSGTGALTFGSGETITRQDMATMIYRAVLKLKVTLPNDKLTAFKDAEMIAGYATEAVNKLAAAGVISGMGDDTFAPGACATRAQAISMIFAIRSLMK